MTKTSPDDWTLVRNLIRDVPDFPKPGILFRDITPVLHHQGGLQAATRLHVHHIQDLHPKSTNRSGSSETQIVDHPDLVDPRDRRLQTMGADLAERPHIDRICGIESRGFLFGMALALELNTGFFPARKPGKLPSRTVEQSYALEYGSDRLQIHADAVMPGDRVVVVDDLLATGGTANAAAQLVESLGGVVVAVLVLIELVAFRGRQKLDGLRVESVFKF